MFLRKKKIGERLLLNLTVLAAGVKKKGKLERLGERIGGRWTDGLTMLRPENLLRTDLCQQLTGGMMLIIAVLAMKQGVIANGL